MRLAVRLAGRLSVEREGRTADDKRLGRQGRLVVAYLVSERHRPVSRDEIADLVWADQLPPTWETAVRGLVARVRAVFATAGLDPVKVVTSAFGCYQLHLPPGTVVDVEDADRRVALALDLLAASRPSDARRHADAAVEIARQPFLPGAAGAWVEERQAHLDDVRVRALEAAGHAALHLGEYSAAAASAEQAIAVAPLRESAHRLLIDAWAAAGNRGEALLAYERCRRALADELGVNPAPETQALYFALLDDRPAAAPATAADRAPIAELPDPLRQHATRFVGRVAELSVVREAWQRATTGRMEVVVATGDAGIGKTRLVAEFAAPVAGVTATVLYGRCDEDASTAFQPVLHAIEWYVDRTPAGELESVFAGAGALARLLPALAQRMPAAPSPSDVALDQAVVLEALRVAVVRMARIAPLLLVVDDVQWADRSTLAFLRHLLRTPGPLAVLLVATYRVGDVAATSALPALVAGFRRERPVHRLDLTGLDVTELARLVEDWAGHPPPEPLVASLHDTTEGNPLFVHEVLHLLAEPGAGMPPLANLERIPERVRDVILARHDRLGPQARRVVRAAAVLGREFDTRTLEAMGDLAGTDILDGIEEATAARLIAERQDEPGRFRFTHGLIPETIYRELSAVRRERLHAQAATALEERRARGGTVPAAQIAHHLLSAGTEHADRAVAAARAAGADALGRFAYDDATAHFQAALRALDATQRRQLADLARRCELLLELAGAQWRAGDVAAARRRFEEAAEEAADAHLADIAARAAFGAAGAGPTIGTSDATICSLLSRALGADGVDAGLRVRLTSRLGAELGSVDSTSGEPLAAAAVEEAGRAGDPTALAYALHLHNWTTLGTPSPETGLARADRIMALADAAADRHLSLEAHLWRFTYLLIAGRGRDAAAEIDTIERACTDLRQPFYHRFPLRFRACLALAAGALADAERLAADAYAIERRVHLADSGVHAFLHRVVLRHAQDAIGELGDDLDDAAEPGPGAPHVTAVRALVDATNGATGDAATGLGALLGGRWPPSGPVAAFTLATAAETCAVLDDARLADAIYQAFLPWRHCDVVGGCGVVWLGCAEGFLGRLALVAGRHEVATEHLTAAVARDRANGASVAAGRAARLLAALG